MTVDRKEDTFGIILTDVRYLPAPFGFSSVAAGFSAVAFSTSANGMRTLPCVAGGVAGATRKSLTPKMKHKQH